MITTLTSPSRRRVAEDDSHTYVASAHSLFFLDDDNDADAEKATKKEKTLRATKLETIFLKGKQSFLGVKICLLLVDNCRIPAAFCLLFRLSRFYTHHTTPSLFPPTAPPP